MNGSGVLFETALRNRLCIVNLSFSLSIVIGFALILLYIHSLILLRSNVWYGTKKCIASTKNKKYRQREIIHKSIFVLLSSRRYLPAPLQLLSLGQKSHPPTMFRIPSETSLRINL